MSSTTAPVDDTAKLSFKERFSFEERLVMFEKARNKYEGIPVICEKSSSSTLTTNDNKVKFVVPKDSTVAVFLSSIRKKLTLNHDESLFLFINNTIPTATTTFEQLYAMHADKDGFLYVTYQEESVYGY